MTGTPQTYLSVLTFLGLALGFAGGIVAQIKKTSIDVDGTNEKRLTSFGKLALSISIIGFAGSFGSELLKSAISAEDARASKRDKDDEAKWKTRSSELSSEILRNTKSALETTLATKFAVAEAQQKVLTDNLVRETRLYGRLSAVNVPLTNLQITLIVDHIPDDIIAQLRKGNADAWHEVTNDWPYVVDWLSLTPEQETAAAKLIVDKEFVQRMITFLTSGRFLKEEGVLALSLDKNFSTLLCVGRVTGPDVFEVKDGKSLLPSGISIGTDSGISIGTELTTERTNRTEPAVHIDVVKDAIVLSFDLNAESLNDAFLHYSPNVAMNGALPNDIEVFVWTPTPPELKLKGENWSGKLPFDTKGVDTELRAIDSPTLQKPKDQEVARWVEKHPRWMRHMRLQVVPNHVEQISKTYDITLFTEGFLTKRGNHYGPFVRIWHGHAQ